MQCKCRSKRSRKRWQPKPPAKSQGCEESVAEKDGGKKILFDLKNFFVEPESLRGSS